MALLETTVSIPCNGREAGWEGSSFCLLAETPINLAKAGSHPALLPAPASHTLTPCDWPLTAFIHALCQYIQSGASYRQWESGYLQADILELLNSGQIHAIAKETQPRQRILKHNRLKHNGSTLMLLLLFFVITLVVLFMTILTGQAMLLGCWGRQL